MPQNDTTPQVHNYQALVAEQTRDLQPGSALGAGQCQQCGGSPCVRETIGACYSMAEWAELLAAFDEVARAAGDLSQAERLRLMRGGRRWQSVIGVIKRC